MLGEVSTWGIGVFGQCNNLTDIDFGSTTSIGSYAFAGCTSIQDINLENVCKLGDYAFTHVPESRQWSFPTPSRQSEKMPSVTVKNHLRNIQC